MEIDEGQNIYLKQFIQKQENLLLDFLRKNIDNEIKISAIKLALKDITSKYEESQKQVSIQNELMQQAANGVESLTIEKKKFEQKETDLNKTIEDLKKSLNDCKNERQTISNELNESKRKIANFDIEIKGINKKADDIAEEYRRQTLELGKLYQENEELKAKIPINKKNKKPTEVSAEEF